MSKRTTKKESTVNGWKKTTLNEFPVGSYRTYLKKRFNSSALFTTSEVGASLGISAVKLNYWLNEKGILKKAHYNAGWFIEETYKGRGFYKSKKWTARGFYFIHNFFQLMNRIESNRCGEEIPEDFFLRDWKLEYKNKAGE